MDRIAAAFPQLGGEFYVILAVRINELGIGDQRLMDAVNHVIDNCQYPQPTLAQFLNFDVKVKFYTYAEMLKLNDELNREAFRFYKRLESGMYASLNDIEKFNLK